MTKLECSICHRHYAEPDMATKIRHREGDSWEVRHVCHLCYSLPSKFVTKTGDPIHSPSHYKNQVPGIECIDVVQHFNFNRGNIIKYAWRCGDKGDPIQDLRKVIKYAEFEIARLEKIDPVRDSHLCAECGQYGMHVCMPRLRAEDAHCNPHPEPPDESGYTDKDGHTISDTQLLSDFGLSQ